MSPDSQMAYVTLQENNAVAVVDLSLPLVTNILPLGTKDHSAPGWSAPAAACWCMT